MVFIVSLGMMAGLLSSDVGRLTNWNEMFHPAFVSVFMAHFAAVVTAFLGGKMIPPDRTSKMTRASDNKIIQQ